MIHLGFFFFQSVFPNSHNMRIIHMFYFYDDGTRQLFR
ncbi:MAG: hypothetical protein HDKAJFGB_02881 [Anaerolineae bacterium]|nr:hypothetical protein [Anaerolineae bacterium]